MPRVIAVIIELFVFICILPSCVNLIRTSFMTVADEYGFMKKMEPSISEPKSLISSHLHAVI